MTNKRTAEPDKRDVSAALNANEVYRELLEVTPILDDEDEKLYNKLHDAVFAELNPQSFLEKIAAKDFVDKLFAEQRCKAAIVGLIDGARHARTSFGEDKDSEFQAIRDHLPHWQKLQRMIDNSEAGRRSLIKEFRRRMESSKPGELN